MSTQNLNNKNSNENNNYSKDFNSIIPSILNSSEKFRNEFRKKLIFSNCLMNNDKKALKDFKKIIKSSNFRYKNVKIGNNLNNVISNQKKNLYENFNKMTQNKFYFNNNTNNEDDKFIENEEKKLKLKLDAKEINENYKNFKEIEFNNKITKTEKKLRNELLNSIKLKNTIKNYEKKQTEIKPEFNFDENKNYINNVIKNEENYLNNNKENYEKILNEIILKNLNDKQTLKNFKKNFSIQIENKLNMLNYKKVVPIEIDYSKLKEEDSKVDLNKILKIFKKKNIQNKKLNLNNKNNNFKLTNDLKQNDFYSTRNIVNIESNNFFFTDVLNKKREENFDKKFNFQLPKLNEYNELIKTKKDYFQTFKTNQIKKNSQSMSTYDKNRLNFNITLRNNLKRWEIDDVIDDELYI
jgi:hypothetical protein